MSKLAKKKRVLLAQALVFGVILTGFSFLYTSTKVRPDDYQSTILADCPEGQNGIQPMYLLVSVTEKQHGLPMPYVTDKLNDTCSGSDGQTTPDISFARLLVDILSWTIVSAFGIFLLTNSKPAKEKKK